jgi:hypothetical protein
VGGGELDGVFSKPSRTRLKQQLCHAMLRGSWIHKYFELMFFRWRVRATYATDNGNHQSKEDSCMNLLNCRIVNCDELHV